jgi:hypothetical protein
MGDNAVSLSEFFRHTRNSRPGADMAHAELSGIPLSRAQNHGLMCHVRHWYAARYRKETTMAKNAKRTIKLKMEVDLRGEDRCITVIRINGKRISEKAVLALAATLHKHHIR